MVSTGCEHSARNRPWRRAVGIACLVVICATTLLVPRRTQASVVERVVAVVGEQAILLSDLRARARPFLLRIHAEVRDETQRTAAISQMYELLLQRMVDEELQERAATKSGILVSAAEIDQAIARIAAQNGISVEQLVAEARRSGMSERTYRREVRRQVLDAKLMNLRLAGRIRITEPELRSYYQKLVADERKRLKIRPAWIVISAPEGAGSKTVRSQRALARRVANQARAGADFGALARRYSQDRTTAEVGGLLGRLTAGQLPPHVARAMLELEVGQVTAPIREGDQLIVAKLLEREESSLPSFEEAIEELQQRVYMDKMATARRHWLDGLRRRAHVDIRL